MEFKALVLGWKKGNWWVDILLFEIKQWEPALLRLSMNHGKFEYDILGWSEFRHWWRQR
jgi:hypothetical protein